MIIWHFYNMLSKCTLEVKEEILLKWYFEVFFICECQTFLECESATHFAWHNWRTEEWRENEEEESEEEGRANRWRQMHKWLQDMQWVESSSSKQTATAACQTFDQGLMNEANKSHSDTVEAFSPKQACQSHWSCYCMDGNPQFH